MSLRTPLALLCAIGLLAIGGCGDDEDETTTTGTTGGTGATGETGAGLLPGDFAAEADAICAEGDREIDEEAREVFGNADQEPSSAEQEEFFTDTVTPGIQEQIDGLRDLGEPEEGAEEFATFLDDAQAALDEVEEDPSLVIGEGEDPFADVEEQAKALGLKDCASG